jgi:hypothetical protein
MAGDEEWVRLALAYPRNKAKVSKTASRSRRALFRGSESVRSSRVALSVALKRQNAA